MILLRNMNRSLGLMNGTRGVIQKCLQYSVLITVPQADGTTASIPIPRINLNPPDTGSVKINFTRRQLPLRVAYAMTINKSQGQTLTRKGVWLPKDVPFSRFFSGARGVSFPSIWVLPGCVQSLLPMVYTVEVTVRSETFRSSRYRATKKWVRISTNDLESAEQTVWFSTGP